MGILPFIRNIYPLLIPAVFLTFILFVSFIFIKAAKINIPEKRTKGEKIGSIIKYFLFWSLSSLIIFIVINIVSFITEPYIFMCRENVKTFTFDTCSVQYTEYIEDGTCIPEGMRMSPPPKLTKGFENNRKINILNCLCDKGKYESASNFRNEYLNGGSDGFEDPCKNIPEKTIYL